MVINVTKELLKTLQKNNLNLNTWAFLISLQSGEDLYDIEDTANYAKILKKPKYLD